MPPELARVWLDFFGQFDGLDLPDQTIPVPKLDDIVVG
jgi:hypothetical protein